MKQPKTLEQIKNHPVVMHNLKMQLGRKSSDQRINWLSIVYPWLSVQELSELTVLLEEKASS